MKEVNEARDKLKSQEKKENLGLLTTTQGSTMKTGAEDAKVADSMVEHLLSAGSLSFGGTMSGDRAGVGVKKDAQAKRKHAKHR